MITIPERLKLKLEKNQALYGAVHSSLSQFSPWFSDNKTVFFPEYTDHGTTHLQEVIDTADSIITDESWPSITANDSAAIIISTLLHDCAMHLSEDGFYSLINGKYPPVKSRYFENDIIWSKAWLDFFSEAKRFDGKKLRELFGDDVPVRDIPQNKLDLTQRDKLLIGEFLRRYHAILAHHIAINGIPGPNDSRVKLEGFDNEKLDFFGFIARSHNMGLRNATDLLESSKRRIHQNTHTPFIMGVLRISDYIQIHSARAERQLLEIKSLSSPISNKEWKKHHAIKEIHHIHDDPEALYIDAEPKDPLVYEALANLFKDIQNELDVTWSIFGEMYGRTDSLKHLGINIRRIRSSLDSVQKFINEKKPNFIPKTLKLRTSDSDMISLLIAPLYGNKPGVGIRELMQNAVDACNELNDYYYKRGMNIESESSIGVVIKLENNEAENIKTLTISDTGIGMSLSVIENYFLNIGASFRKSDSWKEMHETDGHSNVNRTGRFGIGLLAAYLLGDEISVKTRHVSEDKGFKFSCRQDSDSICVEPIDFRIGTEISIVINDYTYDGLKNKNYDNDFYWDWYCLNSPRVSRVVSKDGNGDEIILEQKMTVPQSNEDIEGGPWNRTLHDDFDDIIWGYANLRERYYYTELICNGIKINGSKTSFDMNISSGYFDMEIKHPSLIIYDQDGRMPINLQRDGLSSRKLPFHDELLHDVSILLSKKIIEEFSKNSREISKELISKIIAPGIDMISNGDGSTDDFSKLGIFKNKLFPLNGNIIKKLKPPCITIDFVHMDNDIGIWKSTALMKISTYYIPYNSRRGSKSSKVNLLRSVLESDNLYRNVFYKYPISGKRIYISKREMSQIVSQSGYPRTLWAKLKTEWENETWKVLSIGETPDLESDIEQVISELTRINQPFIVRVYFDWEREDSIAESNIFTKAWEDTAKGLLI